MAAEDVDNAFTDQITYFTLHVTYASNSELPSNISYRGKGIWVTDEHGWVSFLFLKDLQTTHKSARIRVTTALNLMVQILHHIITMDTW